LNRQIVIATILYIVSVAILEIVIDIENPNSTIEKIGTIIVVGSILGYILNSYILSQKFNTEEKILHITKEIIHELKIPIATIKANIALLERNQKDNPKSIKRLERIKNSIIRLERLYQELVYSIKKGIHIIEKSRVDIKDIIYDRVNEFKLLNRNPFRLNLESCIIEIDKIGFEKMLDNIIDNAMKYSEKSSPITIVLKDGILSIEDRGVGICQTELIKIYDRYYQSNIKSSGSGIGLAIVKEYCDENGIKIWIDSQKGVGTKVSFDLSKLL
jgi:signal transduction histidine kinase